jgi:NarL family two-component system sensor histidine kinase LiaS
MQEQERLAEVLHETFAQDLSFISMIARRTTAQDAPAAMHEIADVADRMAGSLRTILLELKQPAEEPLRDVLARVGMAVAKRSGTRLLVTISPQIRASLEQKVTLGRVVREAVANAVRHGQARSIVVRAEQGQDRITVEIEDDGGGFDPRESRRVDAFGIDGMRSAVESIGGTLHISSRPGGGTSVRVELP